MRVLVAGGAGFIGHHLCAVLLDRGDAVVCIDNLSTGDVDNLAGLHGRPGFEFVAGDITAGVEVSGSIDAVMNLASPASPKDFGPLALQILAAGSSGTRNLLELALAHGARFLQASTSEVYGEPAVHPQPETYWGNVNPIGPRSVYDEAKRFGEALTMAYHRTHGLEVRIVRIFNTYGPGMRPADGRVVSSFISQALAGQPLTIFGDGSQTRSFCYVDDQVAGQLALLDSDQVGPINVGNPHEFTVRRLAELVISLTGSTSQVSFEPLPTDDPTQRCPDITLARTRLGWEPVVTLEEGLARSIPWFGGPGPPDPMSPAEVSAVVVNYNARPLLGACLRSLRTAGVSEVVIVDNGSTDGSRSEAAAVDPDATWVEGGGNIGYGRAANIGAAHFRSNFLLVCNPDLEVRADAVEVMLTRLRREPDLAVVGPRLVNPDGTLYPSARAFPNLVDAIGHGLAGMVWPSNPWSRHYKLLDWDHREPRRVDWVSGACFLVRRQAWDALGGFNPRYYMYLEDVDLCWRAERAGWAVAYEPAAEVMHVQGVSSGQHPYRMIVAHHASMWRFARQSTTGPRRLLLPVVGAGLLARVVVACGHHRLGRQQVQQTVEVSEKTEVDLRGRQGPRAGVE